MTDTNKRNRFDDIDQAELEGMSDIGADAMTKNYPFIKFKPLTTKEGNVVTHHPQWLIGTDNVADRIMIALVDEAAQGFARFKDEGAKGDTVLEQYMKSVLVPRKERQLRPNSYTDRTLWKPWDKDNKDPDRRKDPWQQQISIAFKDPDTGKVCVFHATSAGARFTVGSVLLGFKETRRRPLVQLSAEKRDGSNELDPVLIITGYSEDDTPTPGLNLARNKEVDADLVDMPAAPQAPPLNGSGGGSPYRDMDDDVPF